MSELPKKCQVAGIENGDAEKEIREFVDERCSGLLEAVECASTSAAEVSILIEIAHDFYNQFLQSKDGDPKTIDALIGSEFDRILLADKSRDNRSLTIGSGVSPRLKRIFNDFRNFENFTYDDFKNEKSKSENLTRNSYDLQIQVFIKAFESIGNTRTNPDLQNTLNALKNANPIATQGVKCAKEILNFFNDLQGVTDSLQGLLGSRGASGLLDQIRLLNPFSSEETKEEIRRKNNEELERINKIDKGAEKFISTTGIPPNFKEECVLLSKIYDLAEFKKSKSKQVRLPYTDFSEIVTTNCGPNGTGGQEFSILINSNSPITLDGEAFGFMNDLTQAEHLSNLFNLTTAQISSLVPTVRLFKVATDPKTGKDIDHIEVEFDTNPSVNKFSGENSSLSLFKDKKKRGVGVGLKDFNFTFRGSDPFSIKKDITASLSIYGTSFGDLIEKRIGKGISSGVTKEYSFADLALKTGKTPDSFKKGKTPEELSAIDKLNFRLKVVVGWAIPQNYLASFSEEDRAAIDDAFMVLNLTPVAHNFNFDEQGGVEFKIDYYAYITDYFNNQVFNIFSNEEVEKNRIGREILYKFLQTINCDPENLKEIKEADSQIIASEKATSFQSIISTLKMRKKIYFYNLTMTDIKNFIFTGRIPDTVKPTTAPEIDEDAITGHFANVMASRKLSEEEQSKLKLSLRARSLSEGKVSFFFLSDLLDVIMNNIDKSLESLENSAKENNLFFSYIENLEASGFTFPPKLKKDFQEFLKNIDDVKSDSATFNQWSSFVKQKIFSLKAAKKQFEKMRIVLGPAEIVDPFDYKNNIQCSLGDLPISVNYFVDFMTSKMISNEQVFYPLNNFVKDLVNELLNSFLGNDSCFDFNLKQKVRIHSSTVTAFSSPDNEERIDDLTKYCQQAGGRANIKSLLKKPVLNVAGPSRLPVVLTQNDREYNYFVFYAGRSYPLEEMAGNEAEDNKRGIFHYVLGKDRGLIQTIRLDKTDSTGLKELRFEKEGYDGLTQLREVYNTNITCFLNPNVFPGTYIYVDPKGFIPEFEKPEEFTKFGIGGYYMVVSSENSIAPGNAQTNIVAKWVADTGGRARSNEAGEEAVGEDKPIKCIQKYRTLEPPPTPPSTTTTEFKPGMEPKV